MRETKPGAADLHIHTSYGDGMADLPELLDYVQRRTNLDVIAITDHDEIEGSLKARDIVAKGGYRFDVIPGMEISTSEGHLLALFLEKPVPSRRPVMETIATVHALGGLCIIPHPMSWLTHSVGQSTLERLLRSRDREILPDGLETANATIAGKVTYEKVRLLNTERYHLAETGGSDAHFLAQVGSGYTTFKGRSAADLRWSLENCVTRGTCGASVKLSRIGYGKVLRQQWKSLVMLPSRSLNRSIKRIFAGLMRESRSSIPL